MTTARIMHIASPMSWRGGEQQVAFLYEELQKLGVHQLLVCAKGSLMEAYCKEHNFHHVALKKRTSVDFGFAKQMKKLCVEEGINLMHPHDSHAHTFSIISKVFYKNPADIILERRVDFPISKNWFSRYKYNHPAIKSIICVSKAIAEVMRPDLTHPEKMTIVYDGIDLQKFDAGSKGILRKEYDIPNEMPLVGNVAALVQQKDYFTFIDTVGLLVERGVKAMFLAIGKGEQEEELKTYAQEKGLDQHIIFTGFRTDIPQILPELDILLFSSEMEGLGTTLLDAFAAKVPVVTTNAGGIPEIVEHMHNGWLGEVKNPESLAEGVETLLGDNALANAFRENAQKRVQAFGVAETARKTLAVYQEVLG